MSESDLHLHSKGGLTRRTLIGGAAAAGASVALPDAVAPADGAVRRRRRARRLHADVVVVGAGLAGLSAAREIRRAGRSVIVLEARNRVGGRTLNHSLGARKIVEVGGQWVGPTQDRIQSLARAVGVSTFNTYNTGKNVYLRDGVLRQYAGAVPPDPDGLADVATALAKLDQMALTVPLQAPWTAPNAVEWDSQTAETWKLANMTTVGGRLLLDLGIEAVWAAEPRDISLLHVLFYIHSAGNETTPGTFERLINTAAGAQESRFVGGSQLVSIRAAAALGKRVMLGTPVRRIVQGHGGVTVHSDRATVKGRTVIVTGPPSLTAQIRYEPDLPQTRAQLLQRFPQGSAIKCEAIYDRPFWRDQGLTGQATSDTGPVRVTYDNSPPDGSPGVLLGFIEGQAARRFGVVSAAQRRAAVLANFVSYFGPQAAKPRSYIEMNWSAEPWTRGCYVGFTAPGVLLDYGRAIRAPIGRIFWAGAETSDYWNGYMDGAVRSGVRAAHEALA